MTDSERENRAFAVVKEMIKADWNTTPEELQDTLSKEGIHIALSIASNLLENERLLTHFRKEETKLSDDERYYQKARLEGDFLPGGRVGFAWGALEALQEMARDETLEPLFDAGAVDYQRNLNYWCDRIMHEAMNG